jgi:nucleotide-binding universal stress UspA family protein
MRTGEEKSQQATVNIRVNLLILKLDHKLKNPCSSKIYNSIFLNCFNVNEITNHVVPFPKKLKTLIIYNYENSNYYILFIHKYVMFESSRSYFLKMEHIIVPMFGGTNSSKVLKLSYDIAREFNSEITAITIRDTANGNNSARLGLVTEAYNEGKKAGIKVIPKIQTYNNARDGIIVEVSGHNYDIILLSTRKRSMLSSSVFGNIGDYVMKNSSIPAAILSSGGREYPYANILLPLSESINTRAAVYFAMKLAKINKSRVTILDLRKYDRHPKHGFKTLMDNPAVLYDSNTDIQIIRSGEFTGIKEEVGSYIKSDNPDCIIVGAKKSDNYRMTSDIKFIIKEPEIDTILVKK